MDIHRHLETLFGRESESQVLNADGPKKTCSRSPTLQRVLAMELQSLPHVDRRALQHIRDEPISLVFQGVHQKVMRFSLNDTELDGRELVKYLATLKSCIFQCKRKR